MTLVVALLCVVVALLTLLVAGLLRSHAEILRRLHELGAGIEEGDPAAVPPSSMRARGGGVSASYEPVPAPRRTRPAHDVVGRTLAGDPVGVSITGVGHDTVLWFLSSGCTTCEAFWAVLADGAPGLPRDARLVVVTRGPDEESPAALSRLTPAGTTLVMSDDAFAEYAVRGTPYVVHVEGSTGQIRGEGTGQDWPQVARLLAQATGDLAFVGRARRARKATRDAERERRVDDELIAAGILPGDDRLYPPAGTPGRRDDPTPDERP